MVAASRMGSVSFVAMYEAVTTPTVAAVLDGFQPKLIAAQKAAHTANMISR